jgi:hypothetical protein
MHEASGNPLDNFRLNRSDCCAARFPARTGESTLAITLDER